MGFRKSKKDRSPVEGLLSHGIERGAGVVDGIARLFVSYLDHVYQIEKRIDDFREETEARAEELKENAIEAAYAVKRSLIRSIIEMVFLTTGLLSLIVGVLLFLGRQVGYVNVLIGYGVVVTLVVLLSMKTSR
ncbi:MAG: hypothetical protein V1921_03755 [Candidatus Altiarchaeota archaeon]